MNTSTLSTLYSHYKPWLLCLITAGVVASALSLYINATINWQIIDKANTPNKKHKAYLSLNGESGDAFYGYNIVIANRWEPLGYLYHSTAFAAYCYNKPSLTWLNDDTLHIECKLDKLIKHNKQYKQFTLSFDNKI